MFHEMDRGEEGEGMVCMIKVVVQRSFNRGPWKGTKRGQIYEVGGAPGGPRN